MRSVEGEDLPFSVGVEVNGAEIDVVEFDEGIIVLA